jgi:hypothetical protein
MHKHSVYSQLLPLARSRLHSQAHANQHREAYVESTPHTCQPSAVVEVTGDVTSPSCCPSNQQCSDCQTSQRNADCTRHPANTNTQQIDTQQTCPYKGQPGGGHAKGGYIPSPSTQLRTLSQAGVYCEGHRGAHCGAHSLGSLFGRQITSDPNCLVPLLTRWQRDEGLMHQIYADQTYFSPSGMYTLQALNHWLYKMVEEPVTLMRYQSTTNSVCKHVLLPERRTFHE